MSYRLPASCSIATVRTRYISSNRIKKSYRKPISELQSVTCRMGSQCHLPPDRWTCPALNPARQAGTWFTYPKGMEGWFDLVFCQTLATHMLFDISTLKKQNRDAQTFSTREPNIQLTLHYGAQVKLCLSNHAKL